MTPLAKLLEASIAAKVPFRSQEDKLAWAADLKVMSLKLYEVAAACPHGHPRNHMCDRCWLLHHTVQMLEEISKREVDRVNADYAAQPLEDDD